MEPSAYQADVLPLSCCSYPQLLAQMPVSAMQRALSGEQAAWNRPKWNSELPYFGWQ